MSKKSNFVSPKQINMKKRSKFMLICFFILLLLAIIKLAYLQLFYGKNYKNASVLQKLNVESQEPRRGNIYDRYNNLLALDITVNNAYLSVRTAKNISEKIETISKILNIEKSTISDAMSSNKNNVLLKSGLSDKEVEDVNNSGINYIYIKQEKSRFYPNGEVLAQALGFVSKDNVGVYGVEKQFDKELKGISGVNVRTETANNKPIPFKNSESFDAINGNNLYLTIDLDLQKKIKSIIDETVTIYNPQSVSILVMNPMNGEILGMESAPSFNPNTPRNPIIGAQKAGWGSLTEKEKLNAFYSVWKNPIVSNLYEPGSVFKTLTASIALETASNSKNDIYHCNGIYYINKNTYIRCWNWKHPHGDETLEQAFANSCNPAFVQIVQQIGKTNFIDYLKSFKIGEKTGVDLPAETKDNMVTNIKELDDVRFATMSYGHGVSVTPISLMTAVNSVVNGGYVIKPHIVSAIVDSENNKKVTSFDKESKVQVLSSNTVSQMKDFLRNNVESGHLNSIDIKGYDIGGKSGTTIKLDNGKYTDDKIVASMWSVYPVHNPKYSILVVVDDPKNPTNGNDIAGRAARKVLDYIINREKSGEKNYEDKLKQVPDLTSKTVDEAEQLLKLVNLKLSVYGDMSKDTIIGSQSVEKNSFLPAGSTIIVNPTKNNLIKMPNLEGFTREEALERLKSSKIKCEILGIGRVASQSISPGKIIDSKSKVTLQLK